MKFNKLIIIGFIILITLVNLGACAIFTIGSSNPSSITIDKTNSDNKTINKNKTINYYNNYFKDYHDYTDNDDDEENQKITDLETQMNLLKSQNDANEDYLRAYEKELKEQKNNSNKTTILAVNRGEYKQPWVGPQTHLCPYSAGWPAICGECGQQGGIHQDIIEWMDDNNDCHLTHKECFAKYCVNNNVWPNNHYKDKI